MPWRPLSSRLRDDRGSATAETAIVLPVVVVMVVLVLFTGAGLGSQLRLESAARGAARELARGEDAATAVAVAQRIGGEDIEVTTSVDGPWVQVKVGRTLSAPAGPLAGARWTLTADAEARREPQLVTRRVESGAP
ncbi:TadE family type IV pilus minor pilin [Brachybacterium sp.]|uniref:TadE family type IV pilus minor pilin n=1 Tax=Brachybacterium sp. TaxID=1891286 RepID=UPI002ED5F9CE